MKKYTLHFVVIVFAVLTLFSLNKGCERERKEKSNYEALTDSIKYYKNKLGTHTATIKTLKGNNKDLQILLLDKDKELETLTKEFKKVKSIVKAETVTEIPTVKDSFTVALPCPYFERKGNVQNKHYSFQYKITPEALTLDSLRIPNNITIITGVKRKWFLGKQYVATDVTSSNPYVKTTDLKAYQMEVPNPIYKKWYVWLGAGVLTGVLISN